MLVETLRAQSSLKASFMAYVSSGSPVISAGKALSVKAGLKWARWSDVPHISVAADSLRTPDLHGAVGALGDLLEEANTFHAFLWRAADSVCHIKAVCHAGLGRLRDRSAIACSDLLFFGCTHERETFSHLI